MPLDDDDETEVNEIIDTIVDFINTLIRKQRFADKTISRLSYCFENSKWVFTLKTRSRNHHNITVDIASLRLAFPYEWINFNVENINDDVC